MDIVIPNLGDIEEVEVIELCAAPGDVLEVDDALIVIESDKASMEIPTTVAGVLESLQVAVGDVIGEGKVIAVVTADAAVEAAGGATEAAGEAAEDVKTTAPAQTEETPAAAPIAAAPSATPAATSAVPSASALTTEVEVLVPDIGDAGEVVVIEVAVAPGDEIEVNDLLVVLESDKASMEIAAEHAGTVLAVAVAEGDEVQQGSLIATVQVVISEVADQIAEEVALPVQLATSVGSPQAQTPSASTAAVTTPADDATAMVYAGPAVRRLARELGVALTGIKGTGNRGRIVKDDVKAFVKARMQQGSSAPAGHGGIPPVAVGDYAKFGTIQTIPLTRIQRRGADNLHRSWVNLPHVTQFDEADITDLEEFRQNLKQEAERKGIKVTPLAFLVKACCHALLENPRFNSSLHEDGQQLVLKEYINIGMAVDTPDGLVVPVIKSANQKSIWQLSEEIALLSDKARNKKLGMDDLQGGTFSISSLGALGGTGFTPIVNAPEVAILGVAKLQTKPIWDGSGFVPRKVLPLSLSYDHRVINGVDGGRFMNFLVDVLSDIRRLAL